MSGAIERWRRLQEIFEALVDMPADARTAWLDTLPDPDDVKHEALALASADEDAVASITRGVAAAAAAAGSPSPAIGLKLGPYRLLAEIGSGGMGTVFLAERADAEFDRQVAIKLIRGLPTRDAAERLRRERQILANLEHPHIAGLLDGGTSADGQPYLVMEYVDGEPITRWCRERNKSTTARLELFRKVCLAIQYAHQRLVIHRDLKPANVLVRRDGEPSVLDFGIAKLLDPHASGGGGEATGAHWFTPTYASPEQRRGEPVNTATDVFALGLLLYELLAERVPPTDAQGHLAVAGLRDETGKVVPRELALIVGRATHPEPSRRYASPEALSEDVRRYLRGRPVLAAPDSVFYRTRKMLTRHPLTFAAITLALLAIGVSTWRLAAERDRALRAEAKAQRESATTRHVLDYLASLFEAASPEQTGNKPLTPRELIDLGRREVDTRLAGEPVQRARLLGVLGRIYGELGAPEQGAEATRAAAELEKQHGSREQYARYLYDLGYTLNLAEQPEEAVPVLVQAVAELNATAPDDATERAGALSTLAIAQARTGDRTAALASVQQAQQLVADANVDDITVRSRVWTSLAEVQRRSGNLAAAEEATQKAIDTLRRAYAAESQEVMTATGFMTEVYIAQGRPADAERLLREMLRVRLQVLSPASAWAITVRNNLGEAVYLQGKLFEAIALFRENREYQRKNGEEDSAAYSISLNNLASLTEQTEDYATAITLFREVLERSAPKHANDAPSPRLPTYRQNLGRCLMLAGKLDEAYPLIEKPIEDSTDLELERARRLAHLAEWMRRKGRLAESLRYTDEAAAAFLVVLPAEHPRQGGVARVRGLTLSDLGRIDEAATSMRRAVELLAKGIGEEANITLDAKVQLASLLVAQGRREEAAAIVSSAAAPIARRFVDTSPLRRQFGVLQAKLHDT
jgi:serine/threonine-protein kinase